MKKSIYILTKDLRIHDNPVLDHLSKNDIEFLPVFIFDQKEFIRNEFSFSRMGPYRQKFLIDSLNELNTSLKKISSNGINYFIGDPLEIIDNIISMTGIKNIIKSKEYSYYETQFEAELAIRYDLHLIESQTILDTKKLSFSIQNTPKVFTHFRKIFEKELPIRDLARPIEKLKILNPISPDLDKVISNDFKIETRYKGGERAGIARTKYYLWDSKNIDTYKETRNSLMGNDFSSQISPWLANGSLSALALYNNIEKYEFEINRNSSTYWLKFELLWREYFKLVALQQGKKLFLFNGFNNTQNPNLDRNIDKLKTWIDGKTSLDLINAFMIELKESGWLSNRGRQIVASYFVKDLGMDWRLGASWFEHCLIDYDPELNWGNWAYQAGVGNDPMNDRRFNPDIQKNKFDPKGEYVRTWLKSSDS